MKVKRSTKSNKCSLIHNRHKLGLSLANLGVWLPKPWTPAWASHSPISSQPTWFVFPPCDCLHASGCLCSPLSLLLGTPLPSHLNLSGSNSLFKAQVKCDHSVGALLMLPGLNSSLTFEFPEDFVDMLLSFPVSYSRITSSHSQHTL